MKEMKIGIQLYTIRELLAEDFKGALRELVKLGCDGVEFASYFGDMPPDELGAYMREIGLKTCGMHVGSECFDDPANPTFDYARALGCRYVTISICGDFKVLLPDAVRLCRKAGSEAAANGFQFTYHNHACEFETIDGKAALDILFDSTDARQVRSELDVYWTVVGGADPVAYIRRYADRLPQLHMKDMDPDDGSFTELGRGTVDLAACVAAARDTECEWLIYEQDACKRPQFDSAVISLEYLRKIAR